MFQMFYFTGYNLLELAEFMAVDLSYVWINPANNSAIVDCSKGCSTFGLKDAIKPNTWILKTDTGIKEFFSDAYVTRFREQTSPVHEDMNINA